MFVLQGYSLIREVTILAVWRSDVPRIPPTWILGFYRTLLAYWSKSRDLIPKETYKTCIHRWSSYKLNFLVTLDMAENSQEQLLIYLNFVGHWTTCYTLICSACNNNNNIIT